MRIALFGGSFDPPHLGHAGIALAAAARLKLDRVLMAPVGRQPLKAGQQQSPYADRLAMVTLLCATRPPLEPSTIDAPLAPRENGLPRFNYTSDTLLRLRQGLSSDDQLFCLIGADSLQTLRHWHNAAEAMLTAEWIVASRPGFPLDLLPTLLPEGICVGEQRAVVGEAERLTLVTPDGRTGALWLLTDLDYDISATAIRHALADHASGVPQAVLDPHVADYARSHSLYGDISRSGTASRGVIR